MKNVDTMLFPSHRQQAWSVFLFGEKVNTVFFDADMKALEVGLSLVEHDGLHPAIVVLKEN